MKVHFQDLHNRLIYFLFDCNLHESLLWKLTCNPRPCRDQNVWHPALLDKYFTPKLWMCISQTCTTNWYILVLTSIYMYDMVIQNQQVWCTMHFDFTVCSYLDVRVQTLIRCSRNKTKAITKNITCSNNMIISVYTR